MLRLCSATIVLALVCLAGPRAVPAGPEDLASDQAILRASGVGVEGPALLTFLRKRTLGEKDRDRIARLVKQLGSDEFEDREKASRELVEVGPVARTQLQLAVRDKDLEVSRRAARALDEIGKSSSPHVLSAVVRVLAHHKPAGATEALLDYLASADDPDVAEDVVRALATVGVKDGKADAALVKALSDKLAIKRAGAGEALSRAGGKAHRAAVRKLLADSEPVVRMRVALALLEAKDKEAIPALIELVEKAPNEDRERVEEMLARLAGEKAPAPLATADAAARRKQRLAWDAWYRDNGAALDLAKIDLGSRLLGYTVIAMRDIRGRNTGKVYEIDSTGKVRWEITDVNYPVFAQVVKRDRVLIAEQTFNRISERNLKGGIIWQKQVTTALVGAQRLPNGNTLAIGRNQLIELDKNGKEVLTINRPAYDVVTAARDRDGQFGIITTNGRFVRLDATGKELKSFPVGFLSSGWGTNVQLLPRGRVLVPNYSTNKVIEYDDTGKIVWEASVTRPSSVRRLPNGNTLVTSRINRKVIEIDKNGREVWSKMVDGYAHYADRR